MRALRAVSTEKGRDPADFVLVAYGGSGPVHAAALAAELGTRTAIVPPLAGLFSAAGLLFARAEYHDVRFCRVSAREPDLETLRRLDTEMRTHLALRIDGETEWRRVADVRYRGPELERPDRALRRAERRRGRGACRPLRGRARAPVRHTPRARLAGRHPGAPPRRARPAARAVRATAPASARRSPWAPAAPTSGRPTACSTRLSSRAPRSPPGRCTARCSSTSTTRPSSSRPAGRFASTRRATRSCSI